MSAVGFGPNLSVIGAEPCRGATPQSCPSCIAQHFRGRGTNWRVLSWRSIRSPGFCSNTSESRKPEDMLESCLMISLRAQAFMDWIGTLHRPCESGGRCP